MNNKPIILEIEETKEELLAVVNKAISERKIPCYFLAPVVATISNIVTKKASEEVSALKRAEETKKEGATE